MHRISVLVLLLVLSLSVLPRASASAKQRRARGKGDSQHALACGRDKVFFTSYTLEVGRPSGSKGQAGSSPGVTATPAGAYMAGPLHRPRFNDGRSMSCPNNKCWSVIA